ncbi:MAG: 2-oxo acid dehydrogenase subunit, partial [Solirubrobacterales bacterium]|nr:2-oxo acid dehydrogenase subunit [Solirubrobacterales bacterium]
RSPAEPAPAPGAAPAALEPDDGTVRASPLARRVARLHGVDLGTLRGSGPGGRVLRADVQRAAGLESAAPASAPERTNGTSAAPAAIPSQASAAKGTVTRVELSRLQQVVARRMVEAKAAAPDFVIGVDVDMEEAVALRTQLKALAPDVKPPSFNDFVVKASALALREFPRANGAFVDGAFELFEHVNVGIAVAAEDALVVPTVFHADRKSLGEIGRESRRLAAAVRDGRATLAELSGGTFTVSNLGMFGISEFTSIVNPPQAAILSVGEMRRTPVEHEGEVALRQVMKLRLTCDHRILYGADAAGFLRRIKELLQAPLAMAL